MNPILPFHQPLTAADFETARQSTQALSEAIAEARRAAGAKAQVMVWLSDLHLHASRSYDSAALGPYGHAIDATKNLRLALAEIQALSSAPDLLVFGGDIADSGCAGEAPHDEYGEFQRILNESLSPNLPTLPVLGNHDHADCPMTPGLHQALALHGRPDWPLSVGSEDFYYSVQIGGWRFITLDSRQDHELSEAQVAWLETQINRDSVTPTIVLVHRPWVTVGNWVDDHRQIGLPALTLLNRAPSVKAVFSGHTHKSAAWNYHGKLHTVFPSVAYGIGEPCGWGVVVLGEETVSAVFVKDIAGECYDQPLGKTLPHSGQFRQLIPQEYTHSPLFNPCILPS